MNGRAVLVSACFVASVASASALLRANGPSARAGDAPATPAAQRFHLGAHSRKVTTTSKEAQAAFDRGLTLAFAFSHNAAVEEFRKTLEADPKCAMAWWGIALVTGPHINFPVMLPDATKAAWEALGKAKELASGVGEDEKALIDALGKRYHEPKADQGPEDPSVRGSFDEAYAAAIKEVAKKFPKDADVLALTAEALMDLHPWDFWKADGTAQAWTPEVLDLLDRTLAIDPAHPGALHFEIHCVEASRSPDRALAAADRLADLVPGAGHLVHMPAHIYARTGRWGQAADANSRAIEVDAYYRSQHKNPGFYVIYMAHNHHFLAFTAMMRGRSAEAISAGRAAVGGIPKSFLKDFAPIADGFAIFVSEVLMRFGKWDEVLAEPEPEEYLPLSRSLWRFTRAVALNAKGNAADAEKERAAFREAAAKVPKEWTFGNNPGSTITAIAGKVLDGEMDAKAGKFDSAVASLKEAVALEDAMKYDEPPDWVQPVRHTLGAVLMTAGRAAEAEAVYREDLVKWPQNAWSLLGLAKSLHAQGKHDEAHAADVAAKKAWADADIQVDSTCLCLPGK